MTFGRVFSNIYGKKKVTKLRITMMSVFVIFEYDVTDSSVATIMCALKWSAGKKMLSNR